MLKPELRVLLLAVVVVSALAFLPVDVSACSNEWLKVEVEYANYLDLDGDESQDDVLTVYELEIEERTTQMDKIVIQSDLVLPSGLTHSLLFEFEATSDEWLIIIGWFDVVTESGWYNIQVSVWFDGFKDLTLDYDEMTFDPPIDSHPAPPLID